MSEQRLIAVEKDNSESHDQVLKKIQLKNYRSCANTQFTPQPDFSVLIGPNGSGKTNLLNGILLLRRLLDDDQIRARASVPFASESIVKAWFEVDGKTLILTANITLYTDEGNTDVVVSSRQSWYAKDFTGNGIQLRIPLSLRLFIIPDSQHLMFHDGDSDYFYRTNTAKHSSRHFFRHDKYQPVIEAIAKIGEWVRGVTYYAASQFTNPAACPVSIEVDREGSTMRRTRQRGNTATRFLFDLYTAHHNETSSYANFIEIIGPNGIKLIDRLEFKEIETSSVDHSVRIGGQVTERTLKKVLVIPQFIIGKNVLSPNQLSDGTFKTIALLFYLMTESRTLLLLEEPEVSVHHGLLASILELMKYHSGDQQIVISTHSDFVLDHIEPRSVYSVFRNTDGETTINSLTKAMSARELTALRNYLETEGGLGEYWKHGAFS